MAQKRVPRRVLVIDDDEMSRELLSVLLVAEGYTVDAADSGDAALSLLESCPRPDLILTDMQMPGSTPEQLAGRLRRTCGRRTLLLAMSGSPPSDATIAHFDGFLMKPFSAADLAAALEVLRQEPPPRLVRKTAPHSRATQKKKAPTVLELAASAAPSSKVRMGAEQHSADAAAANTAGSVAVLDETIYRQLAGSVPPRQLQEMYAMCISDARTRIASMRSLAAARDATQFMRQAHAIKGSCGMLGATELHRMASALEKNGPDPEGSSVNSLDELAGACDRLERMLGERA